MKTQAKIVGGVGGAGVAAAVILAWCIETFGQVQVPAEVAAAMGSVISAVIVPLFIRWID